MSLLKNNLFKIIFGPLLIFLIFLTFYNLHYSFNLPQKNTQVYQALKPSGLLIWGDNSFGQLGVDFAKSQNPFNIKINQTRSFSAGQNHFLVLDQSGQVYSWGNNHDGQLGYPTTKLYQYNPVLIPGVSNIIQVAANSNHSLLLKNDGTVWAFGNNFTGQLGDGTNINRAQPIQVAGLDHVRLVAAGYKFSLAIKDDNTLWAWGTSCGLENKDQAQQLLQNDDDNLAALQNGYYDAGSTDDSLPNSIENEDCLNEDIIGIKSKVPKQINLDHVDSVSGGYGHVLALKDDGTVWSFGCNHYEQLGLGPNMHSLANATPTQIKNLPAITQVSAGFRHSLALTKDGQVYAWGHNQFGELGQSTTGNNNPIPTKVEGLSNVVKIAAGFDYSLALKADGTLWGWGNNNFKQLGPKADTVVTKPIQIQNLKDVSTVSAGGADILAFVQ